MPCTVSSQQSLGPVGDASVLSHCGHGDVSGRLWDLRRGLCTAQYVIECLQTIETYRALVARLHRSVDCTSSPLPPLGLHRSTPAASHSCSHFCPKWVSQISVFVVAVGAVSLRIFALRATRRELRWDWTLFLEAECRLLSRKVLK